MIRAHNNIKVLITGTTGWLGGELEEARGARSHRRRSLGKRTSVQADLEDGASVRARLMSTVLLM